jgi:hypothetical protein
VEKLALPRKETIIKNCSQTEVLTMHLQVTEMVFLSPTTRTHSSVEGGDDSFPVLTGVQGPNRTIWPKTKMASPAGCPPKIHESGSSRLS